MGITQERGVALLQGALRYLANPPEESDQPELEDETESSDEELEASVQEEPEVAGQNEAESVVELRAGHQEA
jgi:hypothetical protein